MVLDTEEGFLDPVKHAPYLEEIVMHDIAGLRDILAKMRFEIGVRERTCIDD